MFMGKNCYVHGAGWKGYIPMPPVQIYVRVVILDYSVRQKENK